MKLKQETSAGGIVFKKDDDKVLWLLVKHSQYKKWTFPKGIVADKEDSESKEKAAIREVKEEGGVDAKIVDHKPVKVQYKYRFKDFLVDKYVYYFIMEYLSGDPKDHDWEVEDAKFVEKEEVRKLLGFKSDTEAFEEILLKLESV